MTKDQCNDLLLWRLLGDHEEHAEAAKEVSYTEIMELRNERDK